jgi:hypothetical protein
MLVERNRNEGKKNLPWCLRRVQLVFKLVATSNFTVSREIPISGTAN